ncbi:hypothetical protein [Rhodococcus opacus]|uniref:hypothetical protein n=1 Tax=Rhodococcus opacus TaxID=37919 RepID=UPI002474D167|nr:hypothetical protein [Rhodococcus opacus]MDH6285883.1 hypothetical protein [Rhodococcus opacus]
MSANLRRVRWSATAVALLATMALASCSQTPPDSGRSIDGSPSCSLIVDWAFDATDLRALAGWADAIFVGTVLQESGGTKSLPSSPETQFQVEVIESLKGTASGTVTVSQAGGRGCQVNTGGLVSVGETYLFSTGYMAVEGWYSIAGTAEELDPAEVESARRAADNPGQVPEPAVIGAMRAAIADQIPFDSNNPESAVNSELVPMPK